MFAVGHSGLRPRPSPFCVKSAGWPKPGGPFRPLTPEDSSGPRSQRSVRCVVVIRDGVTHYLFSTWRKGLALAWLVLFFSFLALVPNFDFVLFWLLSKERQRRSGKNAFSKQRFRLLSVGNNFNLFRLWDAPNEKKVAIFNIFLPFLQNTHTHITSHPKTRCIFLVAFVVRCTCKALGPTLVAKPRRLMSWDQRRNSIPVTSTAAMVSCVASNHRTTANFDVSLHLADALNGLNT